MTIENGRSNCWLLSTILLYCGVSLLFFSCTGTRPAVVGNGYGKLAVCPPTPNCVSTLAADSTHKIAPYPYEGSPKAAMRTLAKIIESRERTEIIAQTDLYLYAEFTSKIWRFVDDVEFYADDSLKVIHFRSASRLGKSDMGVNRARMEHLRVQFRQEMGREQNQQLQ
ncbi:MAG: DUF1499 domain-containing protein [Chitinivibrionales bacterium]|nr:DUF1499 domain-containing protein [Chitinivibrionales bacterium]